MKKHFILLNCLVFVFSLNMQEGLFAQEVLDSVRIYFHQGKKDIDLRLMNNGRELERFVERCSVLNNSSSLINKVQVIGAASPEGNNDLNQKLSEKRAEALMHYVFPYLKAPVWRKEVILRGSDWNRLAAMVRIDRKVPARDKVLRLLDDISCLDKTEYDEKILELKTLNGGKSYAYLYKNLFPELRSSMIRICYDSAQIKPRVDTVFIHICDTLYIHDTIIVSLPKVRRPFYMAVKTNLVYDVLLVPNMGAEFYVGKNWSVGGNWMYAWWKSDRRHNYWRIYGGDLELRYWLSGKSGMKPLVGHHIGVYGQMLTYDFELGGRGYLGGKWSYGGGLSYGYSLPLSGRLNMDFTLGFGYLGGLCKEYLPVGVHYVWQKTRKLNWFGPTKVEITLVGLIGRGNRNMRKGGQK